MWDRARIGPLGPPDTEKDPREAEERLRAILDAAFDCIVTMDAEGRILEVNRAAERTFGYPAAEMVGRDLAELIIPPRLREAHRQGLAHYVAEGEGRLLGHPTELPAMRADGSEFPVEIAITRPELPGPPQFTGFLRDVTERRRQEEALRSSRARIVKAADEERRRIERNLHDGAQQRLVAISLMLRLCEAKLRKGDEDALDVLVRANGELAEAVQELRELARGIHPAVLTDHGLLPALEMLAGRASLPVELCAELDGRLPEPVEAAAYYLVSEALTNAHKHAGACSVRVQVRREDGAALVEVADDGRGGATPGGGSGLRGLADRIEALGGRLEVHSAAGAGTVLRARIPCG
jgi:PAS domain S-box-containing protein